MAAADQFVAPDTEEVVAAQPEDPQPGSAEAVDDGGRGRRRVRRYNFASPEQFSKDQIRAIVLVHEDLAARLATTLPAYLRSDIRPTVARVEQGRYNELAQEMPAGALYNVLAFDPLPGRVILVMSPNIAWLILEKLLGGSGTGSGNYPSILTDIGQNILRRTVEILLADIQAAWRKIAAIDPRLDDATVNNLWISMLMRSAQVVQITFRLDIQGITGALHIYIPFDMLKPITTALTPTAWMSTDDKPDGRPKAHARLRSFLKDTNVDARVELGRIALSVRELANLSPGDVIKLDTAVDQPLRMLIGEKMYFHVVPGARGSRIAVRVASQPKELS